LTQSKFLEAQHHWKQGAHYALSHPGIALQLEKQKAYRCFESLSPELSSTADSLPQYETLSPRRLFVTPHMVPRATCQQLIQWANAHAATEQDGWTTSRHYAVPTTDVPVHEVPPVLNWFVHWMETDLQSLLRDQFQMETTQQQQRFYVHDAFLVRYAATTKSHFLPLHLDESTHSLVLALNDEFEFEGGGTYFYNLDRTITPQTGSLVSFRGNQLLHGGNVVTKGVRYILAVFLYLDKDSTTSCEPKQEEDTTASNTSEVASQQESKRLKTSDDVGGFSFGFF
jgi:hypothetical protein